MISGNPFRWTDPSTWPWHVYVWLALFLAGWLKPLWRWIQRQRASSWPTASGEIQSAAVSESKRFFISTAPRGSSPNYAAELGYSYFVAGNTYSGRYRREFGSEEEALEFVRDLKGKPVAVQYNPSRPSTSTLLEASLETLLNTRPPKPETEVELFKSALADASLTWPKPLLWACVGLSAVGLVLSLWVHLGAVMGRRVAPEAFFWILHMGIFVVWLPTVLVARKRVRNRRSKDYWKVVLQGSPDWMRYMVYGFFGYALVNFALFMSKAPSGSGGGAPPPVVWRGFSGHWMLFYSAALATLYSAAKASESVRRCLNGHAVPATANFCSRCGLGLGTIPSPTTTQPRPASLKILVRLSSALLGILIAVLPAAFAYIRLIDSVPYKTSLALAASSAQIQKILGNNIHSRSVPLGGIRYRHHSDFAEWSLELAGSIGRGHLYGVANLVWSNWEFSRLAFASEDGRTKIDLTPSPARLTLPNATARKVYLVPLDLSREQSLDWAPSYYRAKLGISIEILPAVTLPPAAEDSRRHQLIAEKCIEIMARAYPEITADPLSMLIGVTSRDMFIRALDWSYAENFRQTNQFAVISSARLRPTGILEARNAELLGSRLQKLITKNILILYFHLPLSSDYTSLLSGGVITSDDVDSMGGDIIGAEGQWVSFVNPGEPMLTITAIPGKQMAWGFEGGASPFPDTSQETFSVDFPLGLFVQRKTDFLFDDDFPFRFQRVYRNQDDRSRAFGIGASDSLDIFLVGRMGVYVDLILEDGGRVHFDFVQSKSGQSAQLYSAAPNTGGQFARSQAIYEGDGWRITTRDGWIYFFPFRPHAELTQVTVLTGFLDPAGHRFNMERDASGDLLNFQTPSGNWLHFEHDAAHRIRRIDDSLGHRVQYEYDVVGRLTRVTDSHGDSESYDYDDRSQMLTVTQGAASPLLINKYSPTGLIARSDLADGRRFEYGYEFASRNVIRQSFFTDPNGYFTYFGYGQDGYTQSLPTPTPR